MEDRRTPSRDGALENGAFVVVGLAFLFAISGCAAPLPHASHPGTIGAIEGATVPLLPATSGGTDPSQAAAAARAAAEASSLVAPTITHLIVNQSTCEAAHLEWRQLTSGSDCVIDSFTFLAGAYWYFGTAMAVVGRNDVFGSLYFYDGAELIDAYLRIEPEGSVTNYGVMSLIFSGSGIDDLGTFVNAVGSSPGTTSGDLQIQDGSTFLVLGGGVLDNQGAQYGFATTSAYIVVANQSTLYAEWFIFNDGVISIQCGGSFISNAGVGGSGAIQDYSGPNCFAGPTPPQGRSGVHPSVVNGNVVNHGTLELAAGGSIYLAYNATFSNTGTVELDQGFPGGLYASPVPPGTIYDSAGHAFANTGTIVDAGNITGNVSGSGVISVLCDGTFYGSQSGGSVHNGCRPTTVEVAPATALTLAGAYIAYRATVVDTSSSPLPPAGPVVWSDGGAGGSWTASPGSCELSPTGANSSSCALLYRAGAPNASVSVTATYSGNSDATDQFSSGSGGGKLVVGAATSPTLSNTTSCRSLGGAWNGSGSVCTVGRLTVPTNESLTIAGGVTLSIGTSLDDAGVVLAAGDVVNGGILTINGTLAASASIDNLRGGTIENRGTFELYGASLNNSGGLVNSLGVFMSPLLCSKCVGNLTNRGNLTNSAGAAIFDEFSTFTAGGAVVNTNGATFYNNGTLIDGSSLVNQGRFANEADGIVLANGPAENFANLSNDGALTSGGGGSLQNEVGGTLENYRSIEGVSVANAAGGVITNEPGGNLSINATTSNAGLLTNDAGGRVTVSYAASLANEKTGRLVNARNGTLENLGTLVNAGSVVNSAGGALLNAFELTNSATGNLSNAGTIENSVALSTDSGGFVRPGTITNLGTVSGAGTINDSQGTVLAGCGATFTGTVTDGAVEINCGSRTVLSVSPSIASGILGQPISLRAVVTDPTKSPSTPTGNVTWSDGSDVGNFSSPSCALVRINATSAACTVTFNDSSAVLGSFTVTYLGDAHHHYASNAPEVDVGGRTSAVVVRPALGGVGVHSTLVVRANVTDVSGGTPSSPTGILYWSDTGAGGSFGGTPVGTCALKTVSTSVASCSITYSSPSLNGNVSLLASYLGDAQHAGSAGNATIYDGLPCGCHSLASPAPQYSGNFGDAVALSGGRLLVGAQYENSSAGTNTGIAYVLTPSTGAVVARLASSSPAYYGGFGFSVALSGTSAVVGAPYEGNSYGHAYLFNASSGRLERNFSSPHPQVGFFGYSVSVGGGVVVVGAPLENAVVNGTNVSNGGRAYVFSATTGKLLRTLQSPKPLSSGEFGYSVAVNGSRIAVGQPEFYSGSGPSTPGHVFLFNSSTGKLVARLSSPNAIGGVGKGGGAFGWSVALSASVVVAGAYYEVVGGLTGSGRAHAFSAVNGSLITSFASPHPSYDGHFGASSAADALEIVVGAPGEPVYKHAGAGNAYAFALNGSLLRSLVGPGVQSSFGFAVAVSGSQIAVGAPALPVNGVASAGRAYAY